MNDQPTSNGIRYRGMTAADVPEAHAWSDGYDGCCGLAITVMIAVSARYGRISQYVYFAS